MKFSLRKLLPIPNYFNAQFRSIRDSSMHTHGKVPIIARNCRRYHYYYAYNSINFSSILRRNFASFYTFNRINLMQWYLARKFKAKIDTSAWCTHEQKNPRLLLHFILYVIKSRLLNQSKTEILIPKNILKGRCHSSFIHTKRAVWKWFFFFQNMVYKAEADGEYIFHFPFFLYDIHFVQLSVTTRQIS